MLVGLETFTSDIDVVVYRSQNCCRVHDSLKTLANDKKSRVKAYSLEELKGLFGFRSKDTPMTFEDFVRTESRKVLQGKFEGYNYFVRCIVDWGEVNEQYGVVQYKSMGGAKIKARVTDDSEIVFTPCHYGIDKVEVVEGVKTKPIREIVSFRGRFCEQARKGEFVVAQGKVEEVLRRDEPAFYRLLLGNNVTDFLVLAEKA